jgi:hypothetical protein
MNESYIDISGIAIAKSSFPMGNKKASVKLALFVYCAYIVTTPLLPMTEFKTTSFPYFGCISLYIKACPRSIQHSTKDSSTKFEHCSLLITSVPSFIVLPHHCVTFCDADLRNNYPSFTCAFIIVSNYLSLQAKTTNIIPLTQRGLPCLNSR